MVRPKKGEPGYEEANERWRATMTKRYGKEGYHQMMSEIGRKGGANGSGGKGFAANPKLAVRAGRKGGFVSRRNTNGRKIMSLARRRKVADEVFGTIKAEASDYER